MIYQEQTAIPPSNLPGSGPRTTMFWRAELPQRTGCKEPETAGGKICRDRHRYQHYRQYAGRLWQSGSPATGMGVHNKSTNLLLRLVTFSERHKTIRRTFKIEITVPCITGIT